MSESLSLEQQARGYVQSLIEAAARLHMRERPGVGVSVDDDGAVTVEWMLDGRRVGLLVDPNPAESGWWFVCSSAWCGQQKMGRMDSFDAEMLARLMIGDGQPAQDEDTSPEPAVARGRLAEHAQVQLDERRADHGHRRDDGDDHAAEAATRGVPGVQLVELAGEGQEEEGDEVEGRGHYPDVSGGRVVVIPEGGARG